MAWILATLHLHPHSTNIPLTTFLPTRPHGMCFKFQFWSVTGSNRIPWRIWRALIACDVYLISGFQSHFLTFLSPTELWECFCGNGVGGMVADAWPDPGSQTLDWSLPTACQEVWWGIWLEGIPLPVHMWHCVNGRKPRLWRTLVMVPRWYKKQGRKSLSPEITVTSLFSLLTDAYFLIGRLAVSSCFVFTLLNWIYST